MSRALPISSIPTISDLYKTAQLQPAPSDASLPEASSVLNSKVSLIRTSITTLATTSIVNAANTSLLGGGGVDGAIHSAAGPSLLDECRTLNGCPTGSAKITSAHDLPSSYIIHAVGPIYHRAKSQSDSRPAELLRSCYRTSLELAAGKGGSIAFSCLSTGVYGYPSGEAAEVAGPEVRRFLEEEEKAGYRRLDRVVFCCFETKDERAYTEWLPKIFPPTAEELPPKEHEGAEAAPADKKEGEHTSKKLKPDPEDDWEAVEKPSKAASEVSEEGEKIEAVDLGGSDGEKVEKPEGKEADDGTGAGGEGPPKNGLLKDW